MRRSCGVAAQVCRLSSALALLLLASCGGGGGGSSAPAGSGGSTSITVASTLVTASDVSTDLNGTFATITILASSPPAAGFYVSAVPTTHAIASVNFVPVSASKAEYSIAFKPSISLGVGTFTDTVTVAGCYDKACTQPVAGSPQTVKVSLTITPGNTATATPVISSVSPGSAIARSAPVTITVNGGNFAPSSQVYFNAGFSGIPLVTTYVSTTQVTAVIPTADLQAAGAVYIEVSNQATGGGNSGTAVFTVSPIAMTLTSLSPASAVAGGSAFVLALTGSGFDTSSQVQWNGSGLTTFFVSPTQLVAQVNSNDTATAGSATITVASGSFGNSSNAIALPVVAAPPALNALWPSSVPKGSAGFDLTVLGAGFNASSTVQWNGVNLVTTLVSATELRAQVPVADLASAASVPVTVVNTAPAAVAGPVSFAVAGPSPDAVAYQVDTGHSGSVDFATILAPAAWPQSAAGTWTTGALTGRPGTPLIAAGRVFVEASYDPSTSSLVAFDQTTGLVAWGPVAMGGVTALAYDNGLVFATQVSGTTVNLVAFAATTGAVQWTRSIAVNYVGGFDPVLTASNGMVFVSTPNYTTFEFDEASGAYRYIDTTRTSIFGLPALTPNGLYFNPDCGISDYRPLSLFPVWNDQTCLSGPGVLPPTVVRGIAYSSYTPTAGGSPVSVDAQTGTAIGSIPAASVAVNSSTAYFLVSGNGSNVVQAVPVTGGAALWTFAGDSNLSGPVLLVNAPAPAASYGIVASFGGGIYGFDLSTGAQVWHLALTPTANTRPMNVGDGLLVIVNADNSLTAFKISNAP